MAPRLAERNAARIVVVVVVQVYISKSDEGRAVQSGS
jgi:hypothetical protein